MRGLPEIRHGEVWRLFTPMFIHFGFPHIFFNLIALREMGSAIESRLGSKYFLKLVLVIAALSNLAQFFIESPAFGGMSGVVYGLLGFIWMRGKYDLTSGLFAPPMSVVIMVVWFFLCFLGYIPGVANYAHGAGLLLGMAWGYLSALRKR
jgi:GlpG protein